MEDVEGRRSDGERGVIGESVVLAVLGCGEGSIGLCPLVVALPPVPSDPAAMERDAISRLGRSA